MTGSGPNPKRIFLEALELELAEREGFLSESCGQDEDLRRRVDALLEAHDNSEALDGWLGKGIEVDPLGSTNGGSAPIGALGDYELLEKIASGAMGTVYRARQKSLDRIVALKVLRVGRFATEDEVRRFRAEAEAAARLDHPNLVPVYEVGEAEKRNFFSMKLIEGPGLDSLLHEIQDDPRRVARLVATVARAVHHAHQHGLLHRDLKPSNILIDPEGTPHVADFGVAKRFGDDALETNSGLIAGTPAYMAPEQLDAKDEITVRTDVYSLGCVLYELLTGLPPFTGKTIAEVFHEVREKDAPAVSGRNASVPRDMAIIAHKCLSKNPVRRYGSMLALAEDLERWLDHLPIEARPTSFLERTGLYWRRKPVQASLAATVGLLVITLAIGATTTSFVLREYLNRAIGAENTAKDRLRTALLAQAQANLRADRPGRRYESLSLLEQAAVLAPGADLRDQAIKAMTLTDQNKLHAWTWSETEHPVAWDFERERFVLRSEGGTCTLRTFENEIIAELPGGPGNAWGGRFSPDGRSLVLKYHGDGASQGPEIAIWDLERYEVVLREDRAIPSQGLWFHPSGEALVVGSTRGDVALVDMESLELREWFTVTGQPVGTHFDPQGEVLALAIESRDTVELYSYPEGELLTALELEFAPMSLDWSPDGQRLLVGGDDSLAYVLDATSGEVLNTLAGHQAEVVMAHFISEELAITSSWDESTRLWDLRTETTLTISEDSVRARSRDGRVLAYSNRGRGGIWSVDHGDYLRVYHGHVLKGPRWVAASPSGRWMASGGDDLTLLWSLEDESLVGTLDTGQIGGLQFHPEHDVLYASTERGLLRWDLRTKPDAPLEVEPELLFEDVVKRFTCNSDESVFVAAVGPDVLLRDLRDSTRNRVLAGSRGLNRLFMSPDGRYVTAGSWRGRGVRIWDLDTGEDVELLSDYSETTAAFSPDGKRLLTGTPLMYQSWTVGTWELEYTVPRSLQPTNLPGTIAFDETGELVAVAPSSRVVWLLESATGELQMSLDAAESHPLTRMAFLPGNRGIITGTSGRRIFHWNLEHIAAELRRRGLDYGSGDWPRFGSAAAGESLDR